MHLFQRFFPALTLALAALGASGAEAAMTPARIPQRAGVGVLVAALAAALAAMRLRARRGRAPGTTAQKPPADTP